jgi:NAD(P)-dependent dehydrogenase (short-subunit alcohol dehydrogenase family)
MGRLEGKVAIITGGASGIGEASVRLFVSEGARVVIADIQDEKGIRLATKLGNAIYQHADVTAEDDVRRLVEKAVSSFGRLDVLFNNAGTNVRKNVVDMPDEDFHAIMDTNVKGAFLVARAVARQMVVQRSGAIINMSSMSAVSAEPTKAVYAASKGAMALLTRGLALELAPYGIRVNAIAPGYMLTSLVKGGLDADPARKQRVLARIPLARLGEPEEIGGALVFLASDASRYITGASISIDGGWTAS